MSPRVTPTNRIPDIVRAAISVFAKKGFRRALVDEIAGEANISPATLYKYFESKTHLFHYVMEHGAPEEGRPMPSPDTSPVRSEEDLIAYFQKEMEKRVRLESVEKCLERGAGDIDVTTEMEEIIRDLWKIIEEHRDQLSMSQINSPHVEFPELSNVFAGGLQSIMDQIGKYLSVRIQMGLVNPQISIQTITRTILETVGFFAWKQDLWNIAPRYLKEDALPTLASMFAHGLAATRPAGSSREKAEEQADD